MAKLQEARHSFVHGREEEQRCPQTPPLNLKGLSFGEKWDVIGSPTAAAFARTPAPLSAFSGWNNDAGEFSGIIASMKMRNGQFDRKATNTEVTLSTMRRQHKLFTETGSPFRLMCKAASTGSMNLPGRIISRPNHLAIVREGLVNLSARSKLDSVASRRRAQSPPKIEALGKRTHFDKSVTRTSITDPARKVALSEFSRWCVDNFADLEGAWSSLSPEGNKVMNQEEFTIALGHHGYPHHRFSIPYIFTCLVCDEAVPEEEQVIKQKHFCEVLYGLSVGRTTKRESFVPTDAKPELPDKITEDMDPFEAAYLGIKGSALQNNLENVTKQLTKNEPVVGELIEFLFGHFGTLKLAFRQLDLNGNGLLSCQEYIDGLISLRSRKRMGPIEAHMSGIFAKLDFEGKGSITLEDVMYELEKNPDPFINRLSKFCAEIRKKARATAAGGAEQPLIMQYAGIFKVGHAQSPVDCQQFCWALTQHRYPQWHADDLFHRLDKDDSGSLSLSEFTAFLQPEPPVRRDRHGPIEPLGTEHRKQQVHSMHIACAESPKLSIMENSQTSQSSAHGPDARGLSTLRSRFPAPANGIATKKSPNWLSKVQEGLAKDRQKGHTQPVTELSRTGAHVMRGVHDECLLDLAPIGCALADFNEHRERCRITAF